MKMDFPDTIGEDQPRPGTGAAHSTFDVFDHFSGNFEGPVTKGFELGPRKPGQTGSPANTLALIHKDALARNNNLLIAPLHHEPAPGVIYSDGSSEEFVGNWRFGQFSKRMI
jgi:hypothetical protein